ncbi:MAG: ORF6N domain-containing protein [Sediminibacterium sp.]
MNASIIQQKIFEIRGEKVMLDFDLAALYSVETKRLNEQVKRNITRFPADFMFQLTEIEWAAVQRQPGFYASLNRSQIATGSTRNRNKQYLPYAFSEHGATMLASVLRSETAIAVNIIIVRAFIALRHMSVKYKEIAERLSQLETSNQKQFDEIYQALNYLIDKKQKEEHFSKRERIGFKK